MLELPKLWDEKFLRTNMNINTINEAIDICNDGIAHLEKMRDICNIRKSELSGLKYAYILRMYYSPAYESGPYYHQGYYRVVMFKIPILNGVYGEMCSIESSDSSNYSAARLQFNELAKKYKRFNPKLFDDVPDEFKHTIGDL